MAITAMPSASGTHGTACLHLRRIKGQPGGRYGGAGTIMALSPLSIMMISSPMGSLEATSDTSFRGG